MSVHYGSFKEMYSVMRKGSTPFELTKAKKNSKGVKVKLIDAITEPKGFNLPVKNERGQTVYRHVTLEPGVTYIAPDETFLEAIKARGLSEIRHSDSFEKALKEAGIPYEIKVCKSCGGGLKKIKVQIIEVIE